MATEENKNLPNSQPITQPNPGIQKEPKNDSEPLLPEVAALIGEMNIEKKDKENTKLTPKTDKKLEQKSDTKKKDSPRKGLGSFTNRESEKIRNHTTDSNNSAQAKIIVRRKKKQKSKPFILDCCKVTETVLPNYNGLRDRFLSGFFERPRMRRHLISMKMVFFTNSLFAQR